MKNKVSIPFLPRTYLFGLLFLLGAASTSSAQSCYYIDEKGAYKTAPDRAHVPIQFSEQAKCASSSAISFSLSSQSSDLPSSLQASSADVEAILNESESSSSRSSPPVPVGYSVTEHGQAVRELVPADRRPQGLALGAEEREVLIPTALGRVRVRWNRKNESLFPTTPDRSVQDAWDAASRALAQNSFPYRLRTASYEWQVILLPAERGARLSGSLGGACHPAWMNPPADIYVVPEFVVSGCGSHVPLTGEAAIIQLRSVLIHELGHAVEFQLLDRAFQLAQHWHDEGFATFFDTLASRYTRNRAKGSSKDEMDDRARIALSPTWRITHFRGSSEDYARAYALIGVIGYGRGVAALSGIYEEMSKTQKPFEFVVSKRLGWDEAKWNGEARRWLGAK